MPSQPELPAALIFDMDGVLVDSNPFHIEKWKALLDEHRIPYDSGQLPAQILGKRNDAAFRIFFGAALNDEDCRRLSEELETTFRRAFAPHARPLPGLGRLIAECHAAGLPMAVASSAMSKNVEFVVDALGFRPYFRLLVSGDEVRHPKPEPEIYLQAAARLGQKPQACVAFEDSFVGVEAAKRAGMKCVAVASTFPLEDLKSRTAADACVKGFEELSLPRLRGLFDKAGNESA
jgi:beta-phosphoglucomutase family hydrolase